MVQVLLHVRPCRKISSEGPLVTSDRDLMSLVQRIDYLMFFPFDFAVAPVDRLERVNNLEG
jgi:hypothetical protein